MKSRAKEWHASWASSEQATPWSSAVLDAPGEVSLLLQGALGSELLTHAVSEW